MTGTIRWGILGTGKIARILARSLAGSSTGELRAVGSRDEGRARGFAREFSVPRHHGTYEGLVEDPEVELVYVATHHPTHREWATRAADAGKHVLCEKPLGMNQTDASAIVAAAHRNGVFLMEAFAYRCHPQTDRLVEILRAGTIGEIRMIDAVFGYDAGPRPGNYLLVRELGGGSILDVGCYTTSMSHLIARIAMGGRVVEPVEVTGGAHVGAPAGVDRSAAATLVFEGGLLARVACSVEADLESAVRVYGSEGMLTVRSPWLPGRVGAPPEIVLERAGAEPVVVATGAGPDVYTIEVDAVGTFVRAGELSPPVMPWEESLANMRTLDRWRGSIGLTYEEDRASPKVEASAPGA